MDKNASEQEKSGDVERLEKWRSERAQAAEKAKKDRIKQAEKDKAERIKKAAEERKKALAQEETERMAHAAALLPDSTSLDKIRLQQKRAQRWRRLVTYVQVLLFVIGPTMLAAWYVTFVAVPLYEARSVITIASPSGQQKPGLPGILGAMAPQGNMGEAFMAREFINSVEMMDIMEKEEGLLSYYGSKEMDPLQRLRDVPFLQISASTYFHRYVQTSVNIQTGLLDLYVSARSPDDAQRFSTAILKHAETQIRALSKALFEEQIAENQAAVNRARDALETARRRLIDIQISSGYANPRESVSEVYAAISALEGERLGVQGQIEETALSGYSDSRQMKQLVDLKDSLGRRIEQQRLRLIQSDQGKSLNQVLADYEFAIVQQDIANQTWSTALAALDQARSAAALGLSQFQIVVPPNTSLVAARPNRLKTTLFVFLIFFGLFGAYKVFRPRAT